MQASLAALAAAIQSIEQRPAASCDGLSMTATGWPDIDSALGGGLRSGAIHEVFCEGGDSSSAAQAILIHLAWQAVQPTDAKRVIWIGRGCWPYPLALVRDADRRLLDRSVFIDPPNEAVRWWAAEQALRSSAVSVVVADGRGIDMAHSRRLQLAAEACGTIATLARPAKELDELSAAFTRWRVSSTPAATLNPRWTVELLRCKGRQPSEARRCWALEWDHATGAVRLPADLGDRSGDSHQADELVRRSA